MYIYDLWCSTLLTQHKHPFCFRITQTVATSMSGESLTCSPMSTTKILFALIFLLSISQNSDGQFEDYCIADEQTVEEQLVAAMNWACGNGADCRAIQENQPCYLPNTEKDHASYAFNSYYQNMKHRGGSCYFNAAAVLTALNPSHGSCKFEYLP